MADCSLFLFLWPADAACSTSPSALRFTMSSCWRILRRGRSNAEMLNETQSDGGSSSDGSYDSVIAAATAGIDVGYPTAVATDLSFQLNDNAVTIPGSTVDPSMTMLEYLRDNGHTVRERFGGCELKSSARALGGQRRARRTCQGVLLTCLFILTTQGTKRSCAEGGCGACTILLDGETVNACLLPLCAASGRKVTTIEGKKGSEVASKLVEHNGSQCGFCT